MDLECTRCSIALIAQVPVGSFATICPLCRGSLRACAFPPKTSSIAFEWDALARGWKTFQGYTATAKGAPPVSPPPNRPAYGGRGPVARPGGYNPQQGTAAYGTATGGTQVRCTILWDATALAYTIQVPYDPNFIEFLKAKVPGPQRAWDPDAKYWRVEDGWEKVLIALATELWGAGSVNFRSRQDVEQELAQLAKAQREAFMSALPPKERACFEFFELCSLDALRSAFRKMALELHPDRNSGDATRMAKLNAAWSVLEKELSKK